MFSFADFFSGNDECTGHARRFVFVDEHVVSIDVLDDFPVAFDSADFVLAVEITLAVLDVLDFAALTLLWQSEVSTPIVGVSKQAASTPVDVAHFLEHFDLLISESDALLLHDHPHIFVARWEGDGASV